MRTTPTIDDDIAVRLAEERRATSRTFSARTYPSKCLLPENTASTHDMLAFAEGEDWK